MKNLCKFGRLPFVAAAASAACLLAAASSSQAAHAAQAAASVPGVAPAAASPIKAVPPLRLEHVLARDVAAQLSKATGATVLTDSTVGLVPVSLSTVGGTLPQVLKQVANVMPKGVVVRTIMLPAFSPKAPAPSGDDLAILYTSQENLVAPVMGGKAGERSATTINVLGKLLPQDKAAPIIEALDLRPVYLFTNPNADSNPLVRAAQLQAEGLRLWQGMTPEQRTQSAEQQFDALLNMDSPSRQAMFSQYGQVGQTIAQKIQSLPADQRDQLMRDITGGMKIPTPPDGGAAPPKVAGPPQQQ